MFEDRCTKDHSTGDNRKETRQLMVTPQSHYKTIEKVKQK